MVGEGAALDVLAGEADGMAFGHKRVGRRDVPVAQRLEEERTEVLVRELRAHHARAQPVPGQSECTGGKVSFV